jgi:hypothetical protein
MIKKISSFLRKLDLFGVYSEEITMAHDTYVVKKCGYFF